MKLTKKQKILLDFVDGFIKGNGYSPTLREIMRALGYKSVSTVARHVDNLVAMGLLDKGDNEARSVIVMGKKLQPEVEGPKSADGLFEKLEQEIAKRQSASDEKSTNEAEVLLRALEILRSDP